jgi:hypothetical protein
VLIDGDRFRTESPDATYEGVFNINVESQPHEIDVEFVAGPHCANHRLILGKRFKVLIVIAEFDEMAEV